jgi:16S rRNA (cytidine1402-2'-O)-methyltransferase
MLYLVATPIGNLGDITLRALEVLRSVDVIASEDTRKTGILLKHFGISKPQIAFEEHNEDRAGERIMGLLAQGQSVALVTEAGTPGVSDPGYTLVRRAIAAGEAVTMAPGPSAAIMALVLSGLAVHSFTFRGFAPRKSGPRRRFLEVDRDAPHTLIYYESPYRLLDLLVDALAVLGDREATIAHELTKIHESVVRGSLSALLEEVRQNKPRGEYVVVIAGAAGRKGSEGDQYIFDEDLGSDDSLAEDEVDAVDFEGFDVSQFDTGAMVEPFLAQPPDDGRKGSKHAAGGRKSAGQDRSAGRRSARAAAEDFDALGKQRRRSPNLPGK